MPGSPCNAYRKWRRLGGPGVYRGTIHFIWRYILNPEVLLRETVPAFFYQRFTGRPGRCGRLGACLTDLLLVRWTGTERTEIPKHPLVSPPSA